MFIFNWEVCTWTIPTLCFCVSCVVLFAPRYWQPPLGYLWLTCRREKREKTSLNPEGRSDILTSDKLLPFAIWYSSPSRFPWSHRGHCQEYIPQCFMSPCRWQKIMTRHDKLPLRAPQEARRWIIEAQRDTEAQAESERWLRFYLVRHFSTFFFFVKS